MYTRLIQGYHAMDPEQQAVSASAARQLRLMVSCLESSSHNMFAKIWVEVQGAFFPFAV